MGSTPNLGTVLTLNLIIVKKAKEIYENDIFSWYDYQPMLDEFGEILIQVDEEAYQGDSFLIYKNDNKYGLLVFGWGSCSGCDALQACDTIDEVQELMDRLYNSIEWFDSLQELKDYLSNDSTEELKWYSYSDTFKEFKEKVLNYRK